MKTRLIYFFALVLVFTGCDLIKKASTISISTNLTSDIPVVVGPTKSADMAGSVNAVSFSKSQDLTLASNSDVEPYLAKIKGISLNSLAITFNGLSAGQTINSIGLDVTGVGNILTLTNVTMTNNTFTPTITAGLLDQIAAKLLSDKKITITVSGNTSGAMTFTVSLNFDAKISAEVL
jgi:hypothetical protein